MIGWNVETHSTSTVETMNNVNNILCNNNACGTQQKRSKHQLLLAVYDFHHKDSEDVEGHYSSGDTATTDQTLNLCKSVSAKKSGTGTGTTISRNKDCEYYGGKIYETTTTLLDDITLMETESHSPNQTTSVNNSLQSSGNNNYFVIFFFFLVLSFEFDVGAVFIPTRNQCWAVFLRLGAL